MRFLLLIILCLPALLWSQNLIPNPGFEEVTGCPGPSISLTNTAYWHRIPNHFGTPDQFYGDCAYNGIENLMAPGQRPKEGVGYVGQFCYGDNLREYISVRLNEPMQKDSVYDIRFFVLPATGYGTAINSYGVHFSAHEVFGSNPSSLAFISMAEYIGIDSTCILADTTRWTEVNGLYKAHGGEQYATFGNFRSDQATLHHQIKQNSIRDDRSYILLDAVSVQKLGSADTVSNTHVPEDTVQLSERKTVVVDEFVTTHRFLTIHYWDHMKEDGDTVSFLLDHRYLVQHEALRKKRKSISIELAPGTYLFQLFAENLGSIPPNTAAISFSGGKQKQLFILSSDLKETQAIRIIVE